VLEGNTVFWPSSLEKENSEGRASNQASVAEIISELELKLSSLEMFLQLWKEVIVEEGQ
ncbi:hypothetical protein SK128_020831, partial [Halocaridina rubra]